jgi:hypothetical protein
MSAEALRESIFFKVVLNGGSGLGKKQIPSALRAQKITLGMVIDERCQNPPQQENANERQDR